MSFIQQNFIFMIILGFALYTESVRLSDKTEDLPVVVYTSNPYNYCDYNNYCEYRKSDSSYYPVLVATATPSPEPSPTPSPEPSPTLVLSERFINVGGWVFDPEKVTSQQLFTMGLSRFRFSYYDPDIASKVIDMSLDDRHKLAKTNCYNYDLDTFLCLSDLYDGTGFRKKYNSVVACPVEYPIGTIFQVVYPSWLVGEYICRDRGSMIVGDYLDFLLDYNNLPFPSDNVPWNADIFAIIRVP